LPEIRPFQGVLYRVPEEDLPRVLAPPYDVIPPRYRDELYERDARNVVRIVLNRTAGDAGYAEAGEVYRLWLRQGVLAPDPEPALYMLEQSFSVDSRSLSRRGLLARFRAEDPERGVVLPHEQTRSDAREDRYRLLKATRANFSAIFMMVRDTERRLDRPLRRLAGGVPALSYADDGGVVHRIFRVTDGQDVAELTEALAGVKAYIADGHHRYATALRYRDQAGPDGAWTLGYFTPMESPGLVVLPYHRLLAAGPSLEQARQALSGLFLVNEATGPKEAARDAAHSTMPYAFGLAQPGAGALVAEALPEAEDLLPEELPGSLRALDTYFFHRVVLPRLLSVPEESVSFVHSLAEAEQAVARSECRLAALMRPTPVRQIVDVAEARQSMPAKSTFFHPKLPSGLVIHPLVE
jgi:uncharacterized protein (DUF1015 family)